MSESAAPSAQATPASAPVAVPAGSTIVINAGQPAAPPAEKPAAKAASDEVPKPAKADGKKGKEAAAAESDTKAQKQLLKQLGVKKGERDALLEQIKAGRMELAQRKAEAEEARKEAAALKPKVERGAEVEQALKEYADAEFAGLPEALQKVFAATLPEDPMARLKAIKVAKESGLVPKSADAPREVKPATTAAPPGPATGKPAGTLNPLEQWQEMKKAGATAMAANFYAANAAAIEKARASK